MKKMHVLAAVGVTFLLAGTLIGCGARDANGPGPAPVPEPTPEPTETATPTAEPSGTDEVMVKLYFVRGEKIGVAGRKVSVTDKAVAKAAIQALLEGPTAEEKEFGLGTTIPTGTKVNGLAIANGTATVDLSRSFESGGGSLSMQMRVAQVVCTLTQFPQVKQVAFKLDGKSVTAIGGEGIIVSPPVDRNDFEGMLPAILVETPVPGQAVTSPVTIAGSSNVFEATHQINITDPDGLIIAEKTVTATSGTGTRGTWSEKVAFGPVKRSGLGAIIVFEYSAKDGSQINIVEIPVRMTK